MFVQKPFMSVKADIVCTLSQVVLLCQLPASLQSQGGCRGLAVMNLWRIAQIAG